MHSEPQARLAIAAASAIRKPSPGAARAQALIESADAIVHRSGSFAAGIGCLQADVNTLCDEIAKLKAPQGVQWREVRLCGVTFKVVPVEFDEAGAATACEVWINGALLDPRDVFGDEFADGLVDMFNGSQLAATPSETERDDSPALGSAIAAQGTWQAGRDEVATQ